MWPKWPKVASLAQKICTLQFGAFFASKGYHFKEHIEREFDGSNPYIKFGRKPIIMTKRDLSWWPFYSLLAYRLTGKKLYLNLNESLMML